MVLRKVNYIFLGSTKYSADILKFLINKGHKPRSIFYIPQRYRIKINGEYMERFNYNYANLKAIADMYQIPAYEVNSIDGKRIRDYKYIIEAIKPDFMLALDWYYIIPKSIREITKYGSWGIHASLLPKYAGGAPLVWAIIKGEKQTGITLFRMDDSIDGGDIIEQIRFDIEYTDTIKDLYNKVYIYSKKILLKVFKDFPNISFNPQDKSKLDIYPQRTPEDGLIDWNKTSLEIYNFIRAQTIPYPCAFTKLDGKTIKIINAKEVFIQNKNYEPGEIVLIEGKTLVATRDYFIRIGEIEYDGKRIGFENFARIKKIWGGCSRNRTFKGALCNYQ